MQWNTKSKSRRNFTYYGHYGARIVLPGDTSTGKEESTPKRLVALEHEIAMLTKERDILKGQVELLKELVRPSQSIEGEKKPA